MFDSCEIRIHPTGSALARLGTISQGQGHATTFAQILASEIGLSADDITIEKGDTDTAPYGLGTYGSRSTPVAGAAAAMALTSNGSGDLKALELALSLTARHIGFVGSKRKIAHLREKLVSAGAEPSTVARIRSPAGTDIGAVAPQEIALSILADIIQIRRSRSNKRKSTS